MSLKKTLQDFSHTLMEKVGLAAVEPEENASPEELGEFRGFSESTVKIGFPEIKIASRLPLIEGLSGSQVITGGLSPADQARLASMEKKLDEIMQRTKELLDYKEISQVELRELADSVAQMERTVEEMEDIRQGYSSVERNLRELAALYDLISAQFNPFIDFSKEETMHTIEEKKEARAPVTKDSYILEWLNFLVGKVGSSGIPKLMDYYLEVGWITPEISERVERYLKGLKSKGSGKEGDWRLSVEDQSRSLEFIRKFTGGKEV